MRQGNVTCRQWERTKLLRWNFKFQVFTAPGAFYKFVDWYGFTSRRPCLRSLAPKKYLAISIGESLSVKSL